MRSRLKHLHPTHLPSLIRRWNIPDRPRAGAEDPEIFAAGAADKWTGNGQQFAAVLPSRRRTKRWPTILLGAFED